MLDSEIEELLRDAERRLAEYDDKPGALFDEMVAHGIIDREGRVKTLPGGDSESESA